MEVVCLRICPLRLALTLLQTALLNAAFSLPSVAQDLYANSSKLQGKIEKSAAASRLARPAAGSASCAEPASVTRAQGKALQQVQSFDFSLEQKNSSKQRVENGKIDCLNPEELALEEKVGSRIIFWESWHRDFVENLYGEFHRRNHGRYPGSCRIIMFVSKDGEVKFLGAADYQMQSEDFKQSLVQSVQSLIHSPGLRFPPGSRRSMVRFSMQVRASNDNGSPRWGSKHGDIERLH